MTGRRPASTLPLGDRAALASPFVDPEIIASRVERLLESDKARVSRRQRFWYFAIAGAIVLLAVGSFAQAAPFQGIHQVTEEFFENVP